LANISIIYTNTIIFVKKQTSKFQKLINYLKKEERASQNILISNHCIFVISNHKIEKIKIAFYIGCCFKLFCHKKLFSYDFTSIFPAKGVRNRIGLLI